jgi:hypothetical protein
VTITNPLDDHSHQAPVLRRGIDRARLAEVMAAMGSGEMSAVFDLFHEYHGPLETVVRVELRRHNLNWVDADDLHGLVVDACLALAECAGSWNPDGALPWHWARHRITAVVSAWVGQFADSFDPLRHEKAPGDTAEPWHGDEPDMLDLLERLAEHQPVIGLVREALNKVGSRRDQEILVAYVAQQRAGDHSPAITLGAMFGLSPDAVRKAVSRMRAGLRMLVATDSRYAVLDGLPLLQ